MAEEADFDIQMESITSESEVSDESVEQLNKLIPDPKPKIQKPLESIDREWEEFLGDSKASKKKPQKQILERFNSFEEKAKAKLDTLKEEQAKKHRETHTFQPKSTQAKPPRTINQFVAEQRNFEAKKASRLEELRLEKERLEEEKFSSSKPPSSVRSIHLPSENVFEKLYNHSKTPTSSVQESEPSSFKPSVNQKSRDLLRTESVDTLLYQDALRRRQKAAPVQQAPKVTLSTGSQKVLMEKLAREFDEVYDMVDEEDLGVLTYGQFNAFLEQMNYTRNDPDHPKYTEERNLMLKAWSLLVPKGTKSLFKKSLIIFLLCVSDLFPANLASPEPPLSNSSLGQLIDGELIVTKEESKRIHSVFNMFAANKTAAASLKRSSTAEEHSFRPSVQEKSEKLAEAIKQKRLEAYGTTKTEEIGLSERKKYLEKLAKMRKEKEQAELKQCTFKPRINSKNSGPSQGPKRNEALYKMAKAKNSSDSSDNEEEVPEECTFKPQIKKSNTWKKGNTAAVRGADKAIERMKKGRAEQEVKKSMKLRNNIQGTALKCGVDQQHKSVSSFGYGTSIPKDAPLDQLPAKSSTEPNERQYGQWTNQLDQILDKPQVIHDESEDEESEEGLTINVKLPNGAQESIVLMPGDDKGRVIEEFIAKHNLSPEVAQKLTQGIINSLL